MDSDAEPVFDAVSAESVLDAVFAVFEASAWLSDFAAEERLGTAPADEDAADMGVARKIAAARANKGDRENFIVNVCVTDPSGKL